MSVFVDPTEFNEKQRSAFVSFLREYKHEMRTGLQLIHSENNEMKKDIKYIKEYIKNKEEKRIKENQKRIQEKFVKDIENTSWWWS